MGNTIGITCRYFVCALECYGSSCVEVLVLFLEDVEGLGEEIV